MSEPNTQGQESKPVFTMYLEEGWSCTGSSVTSVMSQFKEINPELTYTQSALFEVTHGSIDLQLLLWDENEVELVRTGDMYKFVSKKHVEALQMEDTERSKKVLSFLKENAHLFPHLPNENTHAGPGKNRLELVTAGGSPANPNHQDPIDPDKEYNVPRKLCHPVSAYPFLQIRADLFQSTERHMSAEGGVTIPPNSEGCVVVRVLNAPSFDAAEFYKEVYPKGRTKVVTHREMVDGEAVEFWNEEVGTRNTVPIFHAG